MGRECAWIAGAAVMLTACAPLAGDEGFGYVTGEEENVLFGMRAPCAGCAPTRRLLVGAQVPISVQDAAGGDCIAASTSSSDPDVMEVVVVDECIVLVRIHEVGTATLQAPRDRLRLAAARAGSVGVAWGGLPFGLDGSFPALGGAPRSDRIDPDRLVTSVRHLEHLDAIVRDADGTYLAAGDGVTWSGAAEGTAWFEDEPLEVFSPELAAHHESAAGDRPVVRTGAPGVVTLTATAGDAVASIDLEVLAEDAYAPVCRPAFEMCNLVDDDCDGVVDQPSWWVCPLPRAVTSCIDGTCRFDGCADGFADCNGETRDGCEWDLAVGPCAPAP